MTSPLPRPIPPIPSRMLRGAVVGHVQGGIMLRGCEVIGREFCEHSRIDGDAPATRVAALQQQRPRWDKSTGHEQGDQEADMAQPLNMVPTSAVVGHGGIV
jgi:hypothetical protein